MNTNSKMRNVSAVVALIMAIFVAVPTVKATAIESVNMGAISNFGVLAGSTITNTGPSVINGDVGLFPGTSFTQANATINGESHITDAVATSAQDELTTAYNSAAGIGNVKTIATELGGTTLTPGSYNSLDGTFQLTGTLKLDAEGNSDAVFVFNTASTLITASDSNIQLINGANSCQVFWVVGSSATLGTNSNFAGTILALTSITANNGATIQGRLLARNGAVTLENNVINANACFIAPYDKPEEVKVNVVKIVLDEDGNKIEDDASEFTFELFQKVAVDWVSVGTKTVTGNGTVQFGALVAGTYMVKEINIPDHYSLKFKDEVGMIVAEGEIGVMEVTNIKEAEVVAELPVIIPVVPETPVETPVNPEFPDGKLPEAGSESNGVISLLGMSMILFGAFALTFKKKPE